MLASDLTPSEYVLLIAEAFNRTIIELKLYFSRSYSFFCWGAFNRTIIELKPANNLHPYSQTHPFNRTIIELKHKYIDEDFADLVLLIGLS